jgi:hypothetical protein
MDFSSGSFLGAATQAGGSPLVTSRVAGLVSDEAMQAQVKLGVVPETQWRRALRLMSEEARSAGVKPEQLLVEVKQALGILCDACAIPHGSTRTKFTSRVVTLCIEEYYAAATPRSDGA